MTRREQREAVFELLFEKDFKKDETADEIFAISTENREIDSVKEEYITNTFFGVCKNEEEIDKFIEEASKGWKVSRLSNSARAILRLATYEILFADDIPETIAINEAIELSKKFDEPKTTAFVNGVLNSIKDKKQNEQ